MSASKTTDPAVGPGLFVSLRSFWSTGLSILSTRAELATVEVEEQAVRVVYLAVIGVGALLCLSTAFFFLMLFLVVLLWDHKEVVVGTICGLYFVASLILLVRAKHLISTWPKLLSQTLVELKRDVEGLHLPLKSGAPK